MSDFSFEPQYQESKIEDEPILGTVLRMPDGRIQHLTFTERMLAMFRLTSAKTLEEKYARLAQT